MKLAINGQERDFDTLGPGTTLAGLVAHLGLKGDRIAIEHNREIAPRAEWEVMVLRDGDKLEIVHFVGGG